MKMLNIKLAELRDKGSINRSFVLGIEETYEGLITDEYPIGGFTEQYSDVLFKEVKKILEDKIKEMGNELPVKSLEEIYEKNIKLMSMYELMQTFIYEDKISKEKKDLILKNSGLLTYTGDEVRVLVDLKDYSVVDALRMDVNALLHVSEGNGIDRLFEAIKDCPSDKFGITDMLSSDTLHTMIEEIVYGDLKNSIMNLHGYSTRKIKEFTEQPPTEEDVHVLYNKLDSVTSDCSFNLLKITIALISK